MTYQKAPWRVGNLPIMLWSFFVFEQIYYHYLHP